MSTAARPDAAPPETSSFLAILAVFTRLGLTSFGGPVAHLGYFRDEFVDRRKWFTDDAYTSIVALCQFLPGPASSQVGLLLGYARGGYTGAAAAWLGFTTPSALAMIAAAFGAHYLTDGPAAGVIAGLKLVAVAVVAHAVLGMGRSLCTGPARLGIMAASAAAVLLLTVPFTQILVIIVAAFIGLLWLAPGEAKPATLSVGMPFGAGMAWLALFVLALLGLPIAAALTGDPLVVAIDSFYRAGALVFGGGHVVLPLLSAETVNTGLVTESDFLAGYAAAQAIPGPLFTFAAYLGAAGAAPAPAGFGGLVALLAVFAPGVFLALGVIPIWAKLSSHTRTRAALAGVNAAVVGILLAALYQPVFATAVSSSLDAAILVLLSVGIMGWKLPPWLVVFGGAVAGAVLL